MKPEDLLNLTKRELVEKLEKYNARYDELMTNMVMIRSELLTRLVEEKKQGELVGQYTISISKRLTFKTSLEEAETLGAIKKAVDQDVLRNLYKKGIEVPGVQETKFLTVRKVEEEKV